MRYYLCTFHRWVCISPRSCSAERDMEGCGRMRLLEKPQPQPADLKRLWSLWIPLEVLHVAVPGNLCIGSVSVSWLSSA